MFAPQTIRCMRITQFEYCPYMCTSSIFLNLVSSHSLSPTWDARPLWFFACMVVIHNMQLSIFYTSLIFHETEFNQTRYGHYVLGARHIIYMYINVHVHVYEVVVLIISMAWNIAKTIPLTLHALAILYMYILYFIITGFVSVLRYMYAQFEIWIFPAIIVKGQDRNVAIF